MATCHKCRSWKKVKKVTPGKNKILSFKRGKYGAHHCGVCKKELNMPSCNNSIMKNLPKTKKRPERPLPQLCSACMRRVIKLKANIENKQIEDKDVPISLKKYLNQL